MRQVAMRIPDSTFDKLDRQARFMGITVGMLMEAIATEQARRQFDEDDVRLMRMHNSGDPVRVIAKRLGWTNMQVLRRLKKLHLVPNAQPREASA